MGGNGGRWVRMGADGCTDVQQRLNGVMRARGGVGMHDLGPRVAGKIPGTSCPDSFCQKICKTRKKYAQHERRPGIIPKHHEQTQKRTSNIIKRTQTIQIQRL